MTDREKVRKGLACCAVVNPCPDAVMHCGTCPYERKTNGEMDFGCRNDLIVDAMMLMESRNPTTVDVDAQAEPYWKATCGGCKEPISLFAAPIIEVMNFAKFCPHCGRPLNWLPHKNKEDQE